jgi:hypothetical protein
LRVRGVDAFLRHERQLPAAARTVGVSTAVLGVAVAFESDAGDRSDLVVRAHRHALSGCGEDVRDEAGHARDLAASQRRLILIT